MCWVGRYTKPSPHCMVLPCPMIQVPLPVCSDSFMKIAVNVLVGSQLYCLTVLEVICNADGLADAVLGFLVMLMRWTFSRSHVINGLLRPVAPIHMLPPHCSNFGIVSSTIRWFRPSSTKIASRRTAMSRHACVSSTLCLPSIGLFWVTLFVSYRCCIHLLAYYSSSHQPVLMYGCETWATTKYLLSRLDAFDTWALRKILRILYICHVSNAEVRRTTGCSPLSHLVTNRRLRLFGHIARSSPHEDHHWALAACIRQVPPDWKWPAGRLSHTWLRAIEADLGPLNFCSRLPGERPLLETNGDILWTQQRSSIVRSERRMKSLVAATCCLSVSRAVSKLSVVSHCSSSISFLMSMLLLTPCLLLVCCICLWRTGWSNNLCHLTFIVFLHYLTLYKTETRHWRAEAAVHWHFGP